MNARRNGLTLAAASTIGAAVLVLAVLVAVIGSAQAAPSTKRYDATVHVTNGDVDETSATLTLTLTNDTTSKQTLGSANFTPPAGITLGTVVRDADRTGWDAEIVGGAVGFRSTVALTKGQSVSADVLVSISQTTCTNATWTTRAKQSNDFSGNPGNDFTLNSALSNLRPLGSFDFEPIGTHVSAEVFAPQIRVSLVAAVDVTAFDICGDVNTSYGSNFDDVTTFEPLVDTPPRLTGADISAIDWDGTGAGSATVKPDAVVETGDKLVVADEVSGIDASSDEFDVVETICTSLDTTCHWQDRQGNPRILADALAPPAGGPDDPDPSLGIGFNPDLSFDCNGDTSPVGDTLININPRDYPAGSTVTITLTYKRSVIGGGPASAFSLCLSKDNGETWGDEPVASCPSSSPVFGDAPCILEQKKSGGDLVIGLFLKAEDPWGGLS